MSDDGYDYGELLVVQHDRDHGPAALTAVLDARASHRRWRLVDLGAGAPAGSLERVRGLLVLDAADGARGGGQPPWFDDEVALVREAIDRELPLFAICAGADALTAAHGGEPGPPRDEAAAYVPLHRTDAAADDPVFAGWPDGAAALVFHGGDVAAAPPGATELLVRSDGAVAWRAPDGRSYAVGFHPEVDAATVAGWCRDPATRGALEAAGTDPDALAAEAERRDRFHRAVGLTLVGRWLDAVVGADDPDPKRRRRSAGGR